MELARILNAQLQLRDALGTVVWVMDFVEPAACAYDVPVRRDNSGDTSAIAQAVAALKPKVGKPMLACWMGDRSVVPARAERFFVATWLIRKPPCCALRCYSPWERPGGS
jgi:hypothetical protein